MAAGAVSVTAEISSEEGNQASTIAFRTNDDFTARRIGEMPGFHFERTFPRAPAPEFDEISPAVALAIDRLAMKVVESCYCDRREALQVVSELARERAGLLEFGGKILVRRVAAGDERPS